VLVVGCNQYFSNIFILTKSYILGSLGDLVSHFCGLVQDVEFVVSAEKNVVVIVLGHSIFL
jgi:hypothetical protein